MTKPEIGTLVGVGNAVHAALKAGWSAAEIWLAVEGAIEVRVAVERNEREELEREATS